MTRSIFSIPTVGGDHWRWRRRRRWRRYHRRWWHYRRHRWYDYDDDCDTWDDWDC